VIVKWVSCSEPRITSSGLPNQSWPRAESQNHDGAAPRQRRDAFRTADCRFLGRVVFRPRCLNSALIHGPSPPKATGLPKALAENPRRKPSLSHQRCFSRGSPNRPLRNGRRAARTAPREFGCPENCRPDRLPIWWWVVPDSGLGGFALDWRSNACVGAPRPGFEFLSHVWVFQSQDNAHRNPGRSPSKMERTGHPKPVLFNYRLTF